MNNETPVFGMRTEKNPIENYIGKYAIITSGFGQGVFVGLLREINGTYGILNPHQQIEYEKNGEK